MPEPKLLALECSTDSWSVALRCGGSIRSETGEGGAHASAQLIPTALRLLQSMGLVVADLDAIAFGQGPGAFTGLRTACAVAQGLAFAADTPVLPINTLLAVAQAACPGTDDVQVLAVQDARMAEVYTVLCQRQNGRWHTWDPQVWPDRLSGQGRALAPAHLAQWPWLPEALDSGLVLAGNAWDSYGAVLPSGPFVRRVLPTASSLLQLAPSLLEQGLAMPAHLAQPLYVRDKVAQTTAERLAAQVARDR
jgi:tRNA threonylcarbamoyladenosine biosynthesis protein TsaB